MKNSNTETKVPRRSVTELTPAAGKYSPETVSIETGPSLGEYSEATFC
jgi:hypothetical protein